MKFQAIKGTRDILPPDSALWNRVEQTARETFATYGFNEIRPPIFEQTELFARSIGAETDVVSKEMYTFEESDLAELLELRSSVLAWRPNSEDHYRSYLDFQNRVAQFILGARGALKAREIPQIRETEPLLNEIDVVRESIQQVTPQGERETAPKVGQLKHLVRQVRL